MRILIDVLHPAHVHFFRNFREEMLDRGHVVMVTGREKDVTLELMSAFRIPHVILSRQGHGRLGLLSELALRTKKLIAQAKDFRPDVMTGVMGPSIAIAGRLLRVPTVVFYDTEIATATNRWVYPLATCVVTPDAYDAPVRGNHITYAGYQELAYLHPKRFKPDPTKLRLYGVEPPFSIVRFVSWQASHDLGVRGLSIDKQIMLVDLLRDHGAVVVSSEGPLPSELEGFRLRGPVSEIHHLLAYAQVIVGDSGTMSTEATVLGTPAVYVADRPAGVFDDNERRYGLLRRIPPQQFEDINATMRSFLTDGPPPGAHDRLVAEKIDVTSWMADFFAQASWTNPN